MEEERQYEPVQQYNPDPQYDPGPNRFTFFAGVIMPAISISVEATTHICADTFFDPIPTIWHLLFVIFVPLAQLQVWFAIRRRSPEHLALAGLIMRHQLKRLAATAPRRSFTLKAKGLLAGLALTAAMIGMAELPATVT